MNTIQHWILQGCPTTVLCKISVRRNKYCLEFSITWGWLRVSSWLFHSTAIFETYQQQSITIKDKSPWESNATFIFFCHSRFLNKTVHPFQNFLAIPHQKQMELQVWRNYKWKQQKTHMLMQRKCSIVIFEFISLAWAGQSTNSIAWKCCLLWKKWILQWSKQRRVLMSKTLMLRI